MEEIISRSEAERIGSSTFFTGKPCKRGHVRARFTSNGTCVSCAHEATNATRKAYWKECSDRARTQSHQAAPIG